MYHIIKASRVYSGQPYCGASSLYKPLAYEDLETAKQVVNRLVSLNPVGWNVIDARTRSVMYEGTPNRYYTGQRVLYGNEIAVVCSTPKGRGEPFTGYIWIVRPAVGYESCVSRNNVKPLPNGEL